jgi:putative ABC transport system permease protein
MNSMLLRTSLRYLLLHPWQVGLCVLGVALGVAVVVAIDLANASAQRAFELSSESVAGRATHQIVGGPTGIDEAVYRTLRLDLGVRTSAPIVDGYVNVSSFDGQTVQVLGVDPLAEVPFRSYLAGAGDDVAARTTAVDLAAFMAQPHTVLVAETTATRYSLAPGDTLTVRVGSRTAHLRIVGLLAAQDDLSRRALESLLITDVATAQELFDRVGRLSRVDLILADEQIAAVEAVLPPGAELTRPATRSNALEQMTRAFELNLTALSLLALIVGMFLIYNTVTFSVVQRRALLGTLRCVGVTRGQVVSLVLIEAFLISLVGAVLGLLLGLVLGRGLVSLVTQTINDLYFVVTVRGLSVEPLVLLKGLLLGIGATLLSALVPAIEAGSTPPRTVLRRSSYEERVRNAAPLAALVGGFLIVCAVLLLIAGGGTTDSIVGLYLAFAALFAIVIGAALLTPAITIVLMRLIAAPAGRLFGLLGRMAPRDVVAALSRTSVAVAALMVAISVTIGVGIMVGSFRQTVIAWLDQSLVADVYISAPTNAANRIDTTVDPGLIAELGALPEVRALTYFRSVQVDAPSGPTTLVAVAGTIEDGRAALRFREGGDDASWALFAQGGVLISEPLAYRSGLGLGDVLPLRTDRGTKDFPIAGVYYDYTSDRGVIRMGYDSYRANWDDDAISSLALYTQPAVDVDTFVAGLNERIAGREELVIGSNRALRAGTLAIFDRTFAITAVLQLLATIVAFIGILSALMALQLERARELGMLRANGLTPGQLWCLVLSQTGLMGLTAGLLALPLGIALALVLVYVINRRSFGWTLDLALDPLLFMQALAVALVAALLAGIYPALKMARTSPALALREE